MPGVCVCVCVCVYGTYMYHIYIINVHPVDPFVFQIVIYVHDAYYIHYFASCFYSLGSPDIGVTVYLSFF